MIRSERRLSTVTIMVLLCSMLAAGVTTDRNCCNENCPGECTILLCESYYSYNWTCSVDTEITSYQSLILHVYNYQEDRTTVFIPTNISCFLFVQP